MNTICKAIVAKSRTRPITPPPKQLPSRPGRPLSLADALRGRQRGAVRLIAEWKRKSPSAGALDDERDCKTQLRHYQDQGAAALSIVTEPTAFAGTLMDLHTAATTTRLPRLRKDFLVRPEQVVESRRHGADAVLLIVRCLPGALLGELAAACAEQGLDALIECHDEAELERALAVPHALIGVNNRDLDTFAVDIGLAERLLRQVPADRIAVAESGYRHKDQIDALIGIADAVLVGTALMQGVAAESLGVTP